MGTNGPKEASVIARQPGSGHDYGSRMVNPAGD